MQCKNTATAVDVVNRLVAAQSYGGAPDSYPQVIPSRDLAPVDIIAWSTKISMGAMPDVLTQIGEVFCVSRVASSNTQLYRMSCEGSANTMLYESRLSGIVGSLEIPKLGRPTLRRVAKNYQYLAQHKCVEPEVPGGFPKLLVLLQLKLTSWIHSECSSNGSALKKVTMADIERAFPFLLTFNMEERSEYIRQSIQSFSSGKVIWYDGYAVMAAKADSSIFIGLDSQQLGCASALELAIANIGSASSWQGDHLLRTISVIVDRYQKNSFSCSAALAECIGIILQVVRHAVVSFRKPLGFAQQQLANLSIRMEYPDDAWLLGLQKAARNSKPLPLDEFIEMVKGSVEMFSKTHKAQDSAAMDSPGDSAFFSSTAPYLVPRVLRISCSSLKHAVVTEMPSTVSTSKPNWKSSFCELLLRHHVQAIYALNDFPSMTTGGRTPGERDQLLALNIGGGKTDTDDPFEETTVLEAIREAARKRRRRSE